jgi:hypothetical protein
MSTAAVDAIDLQNLDCLTKLPKNWSGLGVSKAEGFPLESQKRPANVSGSNSILHGGQADFELDSAADLVPHDAGHHLFDGAFDDPAHDVDWESLVTRLPLTDNFPL